VTVVKSYKSNISGTLIDESDVWTVTLEHADKRRGRYLMHVTDEEAQNIISQGAEKQERTRRGRPRGSKNKPAES
jgi:hypothetical protein